MTLRNRFPLLALALTMPAPAMGQSVQEFQLPPAPTPSASPRVQGPVDEDGPIPVRPQPIRTAAPAPRPTVSLPTPTPTPSAVATVRSEVSQPGRRPPTRPTPTVGVEPAPVAPLEPAPIEVPSAPIATATPPSQPRPTAAVPPPAPDLSANAIWPWLAALATTLVTGLGLLLWRRRRSAALPPTIERPIVDATPTATPVSPAPVGQPLTLRLEAVKLTRSFAFATLDYRLTLINRTAQAMSDVAISTDLFSAHGNAPMEQQVALASTKLPQRHTIARLAPGQSQQVNGQVQLPIGEAQVIRQGNLPLFVPLLRLRVDGVGDEPLTRTFVIGQSAPESGRLQPFRLDEGPRSYQPIGQRELA